MSPGINYIEAITVTLTQSCKDFSPMGKFKKVQERNQWFLECEKCFPRHKLIFTLYTIFDGSSQWCTSCIDGFSEKERTYQ